MEGVPGMEGSTPQRHGPLGGLKVLDAGNLVAGPMVATILGDYGADVIKIEHPVDLDTLRDWGPMRNGISLWWKVVNRNKRLVTLDLGEEEGQRIFLRLAAWADVIVENFRPGTLERWNIAYPELAKVNPGVVVVRVSGFGQTGPYALRPGYGTIAEAMSGLPYFTGAPDGPPTLPGFPMADTIAGVFGALAALAALRHRDHSGDGLGQEIDVSLYEPLFRLADSQVIGFDQLGIVKERMGNRLSEDAPRNTYATADGAWVAISASSNRTWARLAKAIGSPDLADDPRFDTGPHRVANVAELDEILAAWFGQRTLEECMRTLLASDVVAGPVFNAEDIFEDPHYRAREDIVEVDDPDFGSVRMQAVIPKFSRTPGQVLFPGLAPGSHNREVYQGMLGMNDGELAVLQKAKVI